MSVTKKNKAEKLIIYIKYTIKRLASIITKIEAGTELTENDEDYLKLHYTAYEKYFSKE